MSWGIPGGRVAADEDVERAAIRELLEETKLLPSRENLERVRQYFVRSDSFDYDYTVFVWRLRARPEVNLSATEHSEHRWCTIDEALSLELVPDQDAVMVDLSDVLATTYQHELFSSQRRLSSRTVFAIESAARALRLSEGATAVNLVWYVAIGPPAAGKSTLLREVVSRQPSFFLSPDTQILKTNSTLNRLLHAAFFRGEDVFFQFQVGVLQERLRQVLATSSPVLVDEGIYSTLAYSRALFRLGKLTADEYEMFYRTYLLTEATVGIPKAVVHLNCPVDTLIARMRGRGRLHEQMYSRSYVTELSRASRQIAKALSAQTTVLTFDTSVATASDIASQFLQQCANVI